MGAVMMPGKGKTLDSILSLYVWEKRTAELVIGSYTLQGTTAGSGGAYASGHFLYSDSISYLSGTIELTGNIAGLWFYGGDYWGHYRDMSGKYFYTIPNKGTVGAVYKCGTISTQDDTAFTDLGPLIKCATVSLKNKTAEYVIASSPDSYPSAGEQNGAYYQFIGQIKNVLDAVPRS